VLPVRKLTLNRVFACVSKRLLNPRRAQSFKIALHGLMWISPTGHAIVDT
jgi:hypothetical protein